MQFIRTKYNDGHQYVDKIVTNNINTKVRPNPRLKYVYRKSHSILLFGQNLKHCEVLRVLIKFLRRLGRRRLKMIHKMKTENEDGI